MRINSLERKSATTHQGQEKAQRLPFFMGMPGIANEDGNRVFDVLDGVRRLLKDEIMLNTDYEACLELCNDETYAAGLDVEEIHSLDSVLSSKETGPWIWRKEQFS
jgi:hypothetical protein